MDRNRVDEKRLLLVDADGPPRQALAEQLSGLGFAVATASAAKEVLGKAAPLCRLVIGDPPADMSAADLCRAWRAAGGGPALALVADFGAAAPIEAAGAVAFTKPVRLADLAAALREGPRGVAPSPVALGATRFDPVTRELAGGAAAAVRLTEKEAAILVYLQRRQDRAVPRDELLAEVWGYAGAVSTHTLETHIYRLRRKLAACAGAPRLMSDGGGYRLEPEG